MAIVLGMAAPSTSLNADRERSALGSAVEEVLGSRRRSHAPVDDRLDVLATRFA